MKIINKKIGRLVYSNDFGGADFVTVREVKNGDFLCHKLFWRFYWIIK
jgi:hypothetical protein